MFYVILSKDKFFKNFNYYEVPISYINTNIINRQSLSNNTFDNIVKIFCVLRNVILGNVFQLHVFQSASKRDQY